MQHKNQHLIYIANDRIRNANILLQVIFIVKKKKGLYFMDEINAEENVKEIDKVLRDILWKVADDESKKQIIYETYRPDLIEDLEFKDIDLVEFMADVEKIFGVSFVEKNSMEIIWDYGRLLEWIMITSKQQ